MTSNFKAQTFEVWDDQTLDLKNNLLRGIYAYGFEKPSPIQKKACLSMTQENKEGKRPDIIAQAQSGTGKTGAFSVSLLQIIDEKIPETQALVLASREITCHELSVLPSSINRISYENELDCITDTIQSCSSFKDSSSLSSGITTDIFIF